MNFRHLFCVGIAGAVLATASQANAGVVIYDNFTTGETPVFQLACDSVFASLSGPATGPTANNASVDLVASGTYGITSFNGINNVVDLDGTTGSGNVPAAILQSTTSLAEGDYTVSSGSPATSAAMFR